MKTNDFLHWLMLGIFAMAICIEENIFKLWFMAIAILVTFFADLLGIKR